MARGNSTRAMSSLSPSLSFFLPGSAGRRRARYKFHFVHHLAHQELGDIILSRASLLDCCFHFGQNENFLKFHWNRKLSNFYSPIYAWFYFSFKIYLHYTSYYTKLHYSLTGTVRSFGLWCMIRYDDSIHFKNFFMPHFLINQVHMNFCSPHSNLLI